jgi:ZIP family zinc transporter
MIIVLLFAVVIGGGWENIEPTDEECWKAIGLSFAAGFSTVLGAFIALFIGKEDVLSGKSKFLAGSLSFAAAVMIYVSLIGVWRESEDQFSHVTESELVLHLYTSLSFFGGVAMGYGVQFFINWYEDRQDGPLQQSKNRLAVEMQVDIKRHPKQEVDQSEHTELIEDKSEKSYIMKTALITAASIIAHNFPEGLVLFLAALVDWQVGVATAFAIALHNLPEGISIAAPYYYASESYWKAIGISLFSGLTEPIGAFIGWAIIHNIWGYDTFGILFGLTAGIMVYVSFAQLLPLARKNDPEDKVTTICCFLGMFVIDLSMWIEK